MNLLKRLFGSGQTGNQSDTHGLLYYVKGSQCGAITRVRIDKRNDLSRNEEDVFYVRKVIVDSECYGKVEIELTFDDAYRERSRVINGGSFVTSDEWQAYQQKRVNLKSD
jgi:hypothetical protein